MFSIKQAVLPLAVAFGLMSSAYAGTKLQVFVTGSEEKAQSIVAALDAAGFGPAAFEPGNNVYRVFTKEYSSYAEAEFEKPRLRNAGYTDLFAVNTGDSDAAPAFTEIPSVSQTAEFKQLRIDFKTAKPKSRTARITPEQEALNDATLAEAKLFDKAMAWYKPSQAPKAIASFDSFLARFPDSTHAVKAKLMRGYWLIEAKNNDGAKEQFSAIARDHAGSPEAGEAALRLAYIMIRENKPSGDLLNAFLPIARGEITADAEVRVDAMLRCAALYHRGKDLDMSLAAYDAIEKSTQDAEVRAFSQMQRAGLIMEKAWNKKATFDEARAVCDDLLARYPNVDKQTRATAALMAMETCAYAGNHAAVLKRADKFNTEFAETPEAPLAYYWTAKAMLETGDAEGAAQVLESVLAAEFPADKRFKSVDFDGSARQLAAKAYRKLGNEAKARAMSAR